MAWQLILLQSGRRVALGSGDQEVGSSPEAAVRIDHPTVSRAHARLTVRDDAIVITDLDSSNGTRVDGRLVTEPVRISGAAQIEFGLVSCELLAQADGDAQAALQMPPRDGPAAAGDAARNSFTLIAEGSSRFSLESLPGLLEFARRRPGTAGMAAQIYAELRHAFDELAFLIESRDGRALAGRSLEAEAHIDVFEAGGFVVRVHGQKPARVNAAPAARIAVALLALIDSSAPAPDTGTGSVSSPARHVERPLPASVNRRVVEIYDRAERIAPSRLSVLIQGETGTGKELLARFLHAASGRGGEFVAVNCAALSKDLLEAELFGIEAGVATGVEAREGRFVQADAGTLLLDEVTEMSDDCQAKLLRVLQEGEVAAVGARHPRPVDVRIIAATNRRVSTRSDQPGPLRPDLVHRLAGWPVTLPPLRERGEDIPQLAAHFFEHGAVQARRAPAGISRAAMDALCAYDWPGNVRELEQEMQRAALFVDDRELMARRHLSPDIAGASAATPDLHDVSADAQRRAIEQALAAHDGNATQAAHALGISRATLYRRMKELGIER